MRFELLDGPPRCLDTSSEDAEGERLRGQDSKRLRSTSNTLRSTTPVSDPGRARAPFELDRSMGIDSVGSPSGVDRERKLRRSSS